MFVAKTNVLINTQLFLLSVVWLGTKDSISDRAEILSETKENCETLFIW
jgi:hypothetical protein